MMASYPYQDLGLVDTEDEKVYFFKTSVNIY